MLTDRDKQIVDFVEKFRCVTRDHIMKLFFQNRSDQETAMKQPKEVCNRRMKQILRDKECKVKRFFSDRYWQSIYYVGNRADRIEHGLRAVDLYIWCRGALKPGETLEFEREKVYTFTYKLKDRLLRTDAVAVVRGADNGEAMVYFFEIDQDTVSIKNFDKPQVYFDYFMAQAHRQEAWSKTPRGTFKRPAIVVLTTSQKRVAALTKAIREFEEAHADELKNRTLGMKAYTWEQWTEQKTIT